MNRAFNYLGLIIFICTACFAQEDVPLTATTAAPDEIAPTTTPDKLSQTKKEFTVFKNEKTRIYNPFELRDPFKEKTTAAARKKKNRIVKGGKSSGVMVDEGTYSNAPTPARLTLDQMKLVGVLLGKERRAMVRSGSTLYVLKEGMKFGPTSNIELKAILPGGVVFVEKIKNVYEQDEYFETIIPVSE